VCDVGPICSQHTRVVILSSVMPASLLLNVTVAVVRPPFDRWFYTVVFVVVVVVCSFFVCLPARPSLPTCPSSPPTWPASLRHVTLLMPTPPSLMLSWFSPATYRCSILGLAQPLHLHARCWPRVQAIAYVLTVYGLTADVLCRLTIL